MDAIDYAPLLPLVPDVDLVAWLKEEGKFQKEFLIYRDDWIYDPLEDRKWRGVQVKCSCCGGAFAADKIDAGACHLSGSPAPFGWMNWGNGKPVISGDETMCPICGCEARTVHIGGFSMWRTTEEQWVTMANKLPLPGQTPRLVLFDWLVRRSIGKDAAESYSIWPYTAWVVEEKKIVRLMGYTKYMTNISLFGEWKQRKSFFDVYEDCCNFYPMGGDVLAGTTAENCKLDRYIDAGGKRVVGYLALWRKYPAVENLVMQGCGKLLDELICYNAHDCGKPRGGVPKLREIDWKQKRPAQMLGLNKDEFKSLQKMKWDREDLDRYKTVREAGLSVRLPEDMKVLRKIQPYNVDRILHEAGPRDFWRTVRYLAKQKQDWSFLLDYRRMAGELGRDLGENLVLWPRDLKASHDLAMKDMQEIEAAKKAKRLEKEIAERAEHFRERSDALERLSFALDGLLIRPCADEKELIREGCKLHHCVANYARAHASGSTAILFIRREDEPDAPFFTLELDEKNLEVRQNRGLRNCDRTPEVKEFEAVWLEWVRQGAPRNRDGAPVLKKKARLSA